MVSFLSSSLRILLSFTYGYAVNESIICLSEFSIWEKSISSYFHTKGYTFLLFLALETKQLWFSLTNNDTPNSKAAIYMRVSQLSSVLLLNLFSE